MIRGMIVVPARPRPLEFDEARSAVLVIDMQDDFGAPGGMFDRAGIDIGGIVAAAAATGTVLAAAREAGVPIVYLKMEHPADLSNAGPEDGPHGIEHLRLGAGTEVAAPDGTSTRILVKDTLDGRQSEDAV